MQNLLGPRALLLAAALVLASCASKDAALREPLLTNPPRLSEWQSDGEATPGGAGEETKYAGALRLPLAEDWSWQLPDDGHWALSRLELNSPAVHGEHVLVGSSRSPGLFVLNRRSGAVLEHIEFEGPIQAHPTRLEDGWLVVDSFGNLARLDENYATRWTYAVGGAVFRSPLVLEDRVLVSTTSDSVVAVGLADGAWMWTHSHEVPRGSQELAILGSPSPVAVGDDVVAGFSDGLLLGLDPATGAQRWAVTIGSGKFPDIQAEPVVHGDLLIAAAFGGPVVGIDARTHSIRWTNEDAGATSSLELAGGYLYSTDTQGRLRCLDPDTGEQVWVAEKERVQFGAPLRAGGAILVGDVNGTLHALDRFEGTTLWTFQPMDGSRLAGVAALPVVDGRQVLFPTAGGRLWSLISESAGGTDNSEEPSRRRDRVLGW